MKKSKWSLLYNTKSAALVLSAEAARRGGAGADQYDGFHKQINKEILGLGMTLIIQNVQ